MPYDCLYSFDIAHSKTAANMQQALVLPENALATVLPLRTQPQAARFAPAVPVLQVCYFLFTAVVLCR